MSVRGETKLSLFKYLNDEQNKYAKFDKISDTILFQEVFFLIFKIDVMFQLKFQINISIYLYNCVFGQQPQFYISFIKDE